MRPIRDGAGTGLSVPGFSEVRKGDGTVLWSAGADIPDSGDLHARYDFSQEDGSLPIVDQTGNGNDLNAGQISGVGASINGTQAGDFDGVNDQVNDSSNTSVPQPHTVAIVYQIRSLKLNDFIFSDNADGYFYYARDDDGVDDYWYSAGAFNVTGGSGDTQTHIASWMFDGSNSVARFDGANVAAGNPGSSAINGVRIGARGSGTNNVDMAFGEALIYNGDKTGIMLDIESYLSNKWGVTL